MLATMVTLPRMSQRVRRLPAMSDSALRVIQKLLSRAEATDFDSERESCLAKVAELMARYSIEEAVLAASSADGDARRRGTPVERLLAVPSPYAARKVSLFGAVGANCGCTVIDIGTDDTGVRRVALIGFPGDVERAEVLVTSLLVQMTRSMLSESGARRASPGASAAWRRSFITGFTVRVAQRLAEARARETTRVRAEADANTAAGTGNPRSVALVLADREAEVEAEVRRRYPHLRSRRMDSGSSAHGHLAGRTAGDRASLGAPEVGSRRSLPA